MKPIIGIVSRPLLRDNNVRLDAVNNMSRRAIIKNGGIPIGILPTQNINYYDTSGEDIPALTEEEKEELIRQIKLCDGILLQGGNRWFEYDEFISSYIIEHDIPALFICMSMQHLPFVDYAKYQNKEVMDHKSDEDYKHTINIDKNSVLYKILGKEVLCVNSFHKYAITESNKTNVIATSPDGVIEAIEYPNKKFILGLQWHPEKMIDIDDDENKIIKYFIDMTKSQ
ncbi:MAG: gamma-glutamyl-gamma-aminobutyrate hydrolase family protein [Bacilli bacterium]|nr:gamma-glutamyl-gamma-aminobutyrate hydrolase family protein [Bacilli bacterium]